MTNVRKISPLAFPGIPPLACHWRVRADGRLECVWKQLPKTNGDVVRLDDHRGPGRLHGSVTPPGEDRGNVRIRNPGATCMMRQGQ